MATDASNEAGDRDGAEGASGADRLTAPLDGSRGARLPFPEVGIGASAGGLEAYTEFLRACPAGAGLAYVLVQHLPPERESLLAAIFARHTRMPVVPAEDGQAVAPDHVYVIRPGHTLTIKDGRLHLGQELAARRHGRPVDDFFRALAEEQQHRAVAVVFSGMGPSGTAGPAASRTTRPRAGSGGRRSRTWCPGPGRRWWPARPTCPAAPRRESGHGVRGRHGGSAAGDTHGVRQH